MGLHPSFMNLHDEPHKSNVPPIRITPTRFGVRPRQPHLFVVEPGDPSLPMATKPVVKAPPSMPVSPLKYQLTTGIRM